MEARDIPTSSSPGTTSNPGADAARPLDPAQTSQPALPRPGTEQAGSDPAREAKRQGEEAAHAARREAGQAAQGAKQTASQAMDRAREVKDQAARATRDQAQKAFSAARQQGTEMLRGQKDRAASQIGDLGAAVHRAAEKLHEENDDNLAGYADALAGYLERCSSYLRERDVNSLVHDTADLARRRPEWVLGGAFVAGLAISRFLKASKPNGGPAYGAPQYRPQPRLDVYNSGDIYSGAGSTPAATPATPSPAIPPSPSTTTGSSTTTSRNAFDDTLSGDDSCGNPLGIDTRNPASPGTSPGTGGTL